MSSDDTTATKKVQDAVKQVQGGLVSVGGSWHCELPGLEVEGVGPVGLPCSGYQAEQIKKTARLAPFGLGSETKVDSTVRHTWQIEASRVRIMNPSWGRTVSRLTQRVTEGLGCLGHDVAAVPYKLLLYEKGSHFDFHVDTEKEDRMFATLIVQLPSSYTGGGLMVRHPDGSEFIHKFGGDDVRPYVVTYAAHFADVFHKFLPIESGYRLVLVYSLCWYSPSENACPFGNGEVSSPPGLWGKSWAPSSLVITPPLPSPLTSENKETAKKVGNAIQEYFNEDRTADEVKPLQLGILLDHMYSEGALRDRGWAGLKGWDASLAAVLGMVNEDILRLRMFLVVLEYSSNKNGEYWNRGFSGHLWLDTSNVERSNFEGLISRVHDIEIVNVRTKSTLPLASESFDFNCGNEASSLYQTYKRHAIVFWTAENTWELVRNIPAKHLCGFLGHGFNHWETSTFTSPHCQKSVEPLPKKSTLVLEQCDEEGVQDHAWEDDPDWECDEDEDEEMIDEEVGGSEQPLARWSALLTKLVKNSGIEPEKTELFQLAELVSKLDNQPLKNKFGLWALRLKRSFEWRYSNGDDECGIPELYDVICGKCIVIRGPGGDVDTETLKGIVACAKEEGTAFLKVLPPIIRLVPSNDESSGMRDIISILAEEALERLLKRSSSKSTTLLKWVIGTLGVSNLNLEPKHTVFLDKLKEAGVKESSVNEIVENWIETDKEHKLSYFDITLPGSINLAEKIAGAMVRNKDLRPGKGLMSIISHLVTSNVEKMPPQCITDIKTLLSSREGLLESFSQTRLTSLPDCLCAFSFFAQAGLDVKLAFNLEAMASNTTRYASVEVISRFLKACLEVECPSTLVIDALKAVSRYEVRSAYEDYLNSRKEEDGMGLPKNTNAKPILEYLDTLMADGAKNKKPKRN